MFKLFQKLKEAFGAEPEKKPAPPAPATPVINERMQRITQGLTASGNRRIVNLSGGAKHLTQDQIRAIRHETKRQAWEREADAAVAKVRVSLGKQRMERLAAIARVLAPGPLKALRAQHPQLTDADLVPLAELLPMLDRDALDDLARHPVWGEDEKARLLRATPEPQRVRLAEPSAAILGRLPQMVREELLRLERAPSPRSLETLTREFKSVVASEDLVAAANAVVQLSHADLRKLTAEPAAAKSVKPAPSADYPLSKSSAQLPVVNLKDEAPAKKPAAAKAPPAKPGRKP